jgi:hypothetical protein
VSDDPGAALLAARMSPRVPSGLLRRWAGLLTAYFTTQTLTQLTSIGAGLLFINFMPVREFALYALAASVISFFGFASDLGSTSSLLHFFHRSRGAVESDFAHYQAAVLSLRRGAFLLGAAAVLALFPLAAHRQGFEPLEVALAVVGVLLCVGFQIDASLRVLSLRLHERWGEAYRSEMAGGLLRLLLAAAMVAAGWLRSWLGVLTNAVAAAASASLARREILPARDPRVSLAPKRYLTPTLPGAIYFAVQGPLTVWIAATFAGTRNLAEVGALGRLGLVVGLLAGLNGAVLFPRLARTEGDGAFRTRFLAYGGLLAVLGGALFLGALLAPGPFLLVLGRHYSSLRHELLLTLGGACLGLLDGYAVGANSIRAWTRLQGAAVLTLLGAQVAFVIVLPLSTTAGVLTFNLLSSAVALATQLAIAACGFLRPQWVRWG